MRTKSGNLHLEIQTSRKNPVGLFRTSARDRATGKIVHTQHGRIAGCSLDELRILQLAFRGSVTPLGAPEALRILSSREFGASNALLQLAKDIGLHRILYSRSQPWVDAALALIVGRIIYQGSKLSLCNQSPNTCLWELCGIEGLATISALTHGELADYKEATTVEILGARIGKLRAKYKMGKFIVWEIEQDGVAKKSRNHRVKWSIDEEKVKREQDLDGCYIIRTDVPEETMNTAEVVAGYKSLGDVERAFRSLKTAHLEIRPIYHKSDDRIKAHVFMCMLAYHLEWHMLQRLGSFFAKDGKGADRRWTVKGVIDRLVQIQRNRVSLQGVEFDQVTEADDEQKEILTLLKSAT